MKSGTWLPSLCQKRGEHRQDSALPSLMLLYSRAGAAHQAQRLPTHSVWHLGLVCMAGWEDAPFPRKHRRSLAPPWAPQASPVPMCWGSFGARCCAGDGEIFQGGIPVPAQPSPTGLTAVIPEDRKICACFSAAAEQLRNVSHHREPE